AAQCGRGDRWVRRCHRHRRCPYGAASASRRLEFGLPSVAAGGRLGDRAPCDPCRPTDALGSRHDADLSSRQPVLGAWARVWSTRLLHERNDAFLFWPAAICIPDRAARVFDVSVEHYRRQRPDGDCLRSAPFVALDGDELTIAGSLPTLILG